MPYVHGRYSGWSDYRYGVDKPAAPMPAIFKGRARKAVLSYIKRKLKSFVITPFEFEAELVTTIRINLVLAGVGWAHAEAEATSLVSETYSKIDARRPAWIDGQAYVTISPDLCNWCLKPIENKGRFCSAVCAGRSIRFRDSNLEGYTDHIMRSARREIARSASPVKSCLYCEEVFQSDRKDAKFCSPGCNSRYHKGDTLLPPRPCAWCDTEFQPQVSTQRYCSHSCHGLAAHAGYRKKLENITRECECCGTRFTPTLERNVYCSVRCASTMANRAYYRRHLVKLHTLSCEWCGDDFTSKMPWAKFCCKEHKRAADSLARSNSQGIVKLIPLTARIFDKWFKEAA